MALFSEDDLLPLSVLADLLFCERRAALHLIERIWVDNLFTVEGTHLHQKIDQYLPVESRDSLRIYRGLMLRSLRIGLIGKADVVEFHLVREKGDFSATGLEMSIPLAGISGRWLPYPVEYKRGRLRHERGFEAQLCAQALCLEEMLHCAVPEGAIFYGKNRRRQAVRFDERLRKETEAAALRLHDLFRSGKTPPARYEKKCDSCSLLELCLPKIAGAAKNVDRFLSRMLAEQT